MKGKRILLIVFILLALAGSSWLGWMYFAPGGERDILEFVPEDMIYLLEAEDPIENWKTFSDSEVWQFLKTDPAMAEYEEKANYLDSLIMGNEQMFKLFKNKKLILTAHMIARDDYDFLYLIDLKKGAKISFLKDVLYDVLSKAGVKYQVRDFEGSDLVEITDEDNDKLQITFRDNILICSYNSEILKSALDQGNKPWLTAHPQFQPLLKEVKTKGPFRVFLNHAQMEPYLKVYLDDFPDQMRELLSQINLTGLDLTIDDDGGELEGYTVPWDTMPGMFNALLKVDGSKSRAQKVLPQNTSFMLSLNFEDFDDYYAQIEEELKRDPEAWAEFEDNQQKLEKFLKIDFKENLLSWIGEEITLAMTPANESGTEQSYVAVFHTTHIGAAQKNLAFVEERFRKNAINPVKFNTYNYKGYDVRRLEMKGFFKLFFGGLFNKFEKPNFIYLDDFVVFCNDTSTLHRMIDAEDEGNPLEESDVYDDFRDQFDNQSNIFLYVNMPQLYPWIPELMEAETRKGLEIHKPYILSLNQIALQLKREGDYYKTDLGLDFEKPEDNED